MAFIILFFKLIYFSTGSGTFTDPNLWTPQLNASAFKISQNSFVVQNGDTMYLTQKIAGIRIIVKGTLYIQTSRITLIEALEITETGMVVIDGLTVDLGNAELIGNPEQIQLLNGAQIISNSAYLPVELISYQVTWQHKNKITLEWTTGTEKENWGFEILSNKKVLGTVESYTGGFSTSPIYYRYSLQLPPTGELHQLYLKQIDFNGNYTLHGPIPVQSFLNEKNKSVKAYPNPNDGYITVKIQNPTQTPESRIYVFNSIGQLVTQIQQNTPPHRTVEFNFFSKNLSTGAYTIIVDWGSYFEVEKLILIK